MSRSLLPKEHGAYAQLGLPLVTALVAGAPRLAAFALAGAAIAVFFAHEPALVLLGRRGARATKEAGPTARRRLFALLALGAALSFPLLQPAVAVAAIGPMVLAAVSGVFVARDRERTTLGEMVIAACLASAAIPVAVAAGWSLRAAIAAWFAWATGLCAATVAVRGVIAARKHATPPSRSTMLVALAPLTAAVLAALGAFSWWTVAASLPLVLVALFVAARPPHPRALRTVGWTLVAATVATAAAIIASV